MKELQKLKPLAEQMLALSAELLGLIDSEEVEYTRLLENLKKTCRAKLYLSRAQ